jgi:hypothetical protein
MATSGSTDFSLTRDDLIRQALLDVGAIDEGQTPSATQVSDASMKLNMISKFWHADGMPLWAMKQTSFALTAATSYTIGVGQTISTPRPIRVYSAFLRDTSATPDTDTPINILTRDEYNSLSSKSTEGRPIGLFYDPQGGATAFGTIYLWPKPDTTAIANCSCFVTYQRPFEDFDAASDTPDFPQEWFLPLQVFLTWAISYQYGMPRSDRDDLLLKAVNLKMEVLNAGMEEGSVYIQPNGDH